MTTTIASDNKVLYRSRTYQDGFNAGLVPTLFVSSLLLTASLWYGITVTQRAQKAEWEVKAPTATADQLEAHIDDSLNEISIYIGFLLVSGSLAASSGLVTLLLFAARYSLNREAVRQ